MAICVINIPYKCVTAWISTSKNNKLRALLPVSFITGVLYYWCLYGRYPVHLGLGTGIKRGESYPPAPYIWLCPNLMATRPYHTHLATAVTLPRTITQGSIWYAPRYATTIINKSTSDSSTVKAGWVYLQTAASWDTKQYLCLVCTP